MPIFVAIGQAVVTALALTGTAAIVVGAIVSTAAAWITSRIINGNPNKGNNSAAGSQGGRIQVPPATNNKIPVVYGSAFVNGIITDARLISVGGKTNDTMFYCIVLSETCHSGSPTYTVGDVYWNDSRLTFNSVNPHRVQDGRKIVLGPVVTAGAFVVGQSYHILVPGNTNFTAIGAATDNPGQIFTATGAGTGTGTARQEDFIDTNYVVDGTHLVETRIYAGGSEAADQIFPATGTPQAAYDFWGDNDNSWTTDFDMKGLVFAIVRLTYNGEKGFTNLPNVTFEVRNSMTNPADVWLDYMTGERYGANIDAQYIDVTPVTSAWDKWHTFCDEDITYTDIAGSVTAVNSRYQINGVIDTSNQVKTNIDTILQNGGAWMSYDVASGLWLPLIKKAITAGVAGDATTYFTASRTGSTLTVTAFPSGRIEAGQELYNNANTLIGTVVAQLAPTAGETAGQKGRYTISTSGTITSTTFYTVAPNLLAFSDDNISTGISISSTRLEDLYNKVEVEFYDKYNRDQKAYERIDLPGGQRNPNEPDNQLRLSLDLCNNNIQANIIGNMEMRQGRDDLVIEFTTSHYGIQAQAGDIIEVTCDLYSWAPKLFRVMRVKEIENEEGGLNAVIQALEYNSDIYTIEPIAEFTTQANIGIGTYAASPNLPLPPRLAIVKVNDTDPVPNFQLQVQVPATGGPYDEIEFYVTEGWDPFDITGSTTGSVATITATEFGAINPGDFFTVGAASFTILAQLTNTPASKTFASGGAFTPVPQNTVTLNNTTGLVIGNTLTGTGLPASGAGITAISGSQVTLDRFFTAQAAGTYTVSGGLGTYTVDNAAVVTGTTQLFDLPEADDYNFFKKITPNGNRATFTNGETTTVTITELPANSQTYRRWFIKSRMGIKKRFGAFSQPTTVDKDGNFQYEPDAGAGSVSVLNIKQALVKLDFQTLVVPNNGFLLSRAMNPVDFGNDNNLGSSGQLDLGLLSVVENAVTAGTDVEAFVWQNDPT